MIRWCNCPYYFETFIKERFTANNILYRQMITEVFDLELNNSNLKYMGFQQDGATPLFVNEIIQILQTFNGTVI